MSVMIDGLFPVQVVKNLLRPTGTRSHLLLSMGVVSTCLLMGLKCVAIKDVRCAGDCPTHPEIGRARLSHFVVSAADTMPYFTWSL